MISIFTVNTLAHEAGLPTIRSGVWELKEAHAHLDDVRAVADADTLVRLRAAMSVYGAPRMAGPALAISAFSLMVTGAALWLVASGAQLATEPAAAGPALLYVVIALVLGVSFFLYGLYAANREASAAGWLYLLDQRIDELAAERHEYAGPAVQNTTDVALVKIYRRSRAAD